MKLEKCYCIHQTWTEPHSPWQSLAEQEIGDIKCEMRRYIQTKNSPIQLWAFLGNYVCGKRPITASNIPENNGRTQYEIVMGHTPDIVIWLLYRWYDWLYYLDKNKETKITGWLGPAPEYGSGDCCWILPISCRPIV